MARKPSLSPTRIALYLECAVKYRFVYVDKIGKFYTRARAGYSFGSTLHHVLQNFHAGGAMQSSQELVQKVETQWISAGYESPQQEIEYKQAGVELIQAYHTKAIERVERQIETLFTEKTIKMDLGDFVLSGRVDRIDRHPDGALEIIDYKSGRASVEVTDVSESLAMNIYQLILRGMYPGTRVLATIYALSSGDQASHEMSDDDANVFEQDMRVLGNEILNRDFEYVEPVRIAACEHCDFVTKCEGYWSSLA